MARCGHAGDFFAAADFLQVESVGYTDGMNDPAPMRKSWQFSLSRLLLMTIMFGAVLGLAQLLGPEHVWRGRGRQPR